MTARRLGIVVVALMAGVAALVLLAHAPPVRRAVLRYAVAAVQRSAGLTLDADRLDYNLAALRVGLAGVRVSAPDSTSEPFFQADYVSVSLPFGALFGDVAFDDITTTNARTTIHRRADGTTNLPATEGGGGADPPAIRIARLDVPSLAVDVRDEQADVSLQVPAIGLLLTPEDGSVSLGGPAELRVGARATRISQFGGQAAFDGRTLRLSGVALRTDEGSSLLDGTILVIARDPRIDLRVSGTGDIARLARWGLADGELPQGNLAFSGTIEGPMAEPQAQLELGAGRVSWRGVEASEVAGRVRASAGEAEIQELRAMFARGTVAGTMSIPFTAGARARAAASWERVDTAVAVLAVTPGAGLVPSARTSGQLELEGVLADPSTWSGSLQLELAPGSNARGRVAVGGDLALDFAEGTWRLSGEPTLARVAPVLIDARGRFQGGPQGPPLQRAIAEGAIDGAVRLGATDVPALLAALNTTGIASIASDAVNSATLEAELVLGGRVADPSVSGGAMLRKLTGPQIAVESIDAQISGRPLVPRLEFTIEAPEAVVAGQRVTDVRATGRLTEETGPPRGARPAETASGAAAGTAVVLDALSARQPTGTGVVTGSGTYRLTSGEYTAVLDGADWELMADADRPLAGRISAHFSGAGSVGDPRGTGQVTLAGATWQDMALGTVDANVRLDGQLAYVDARAPEFDATATGRVQIDAPHAALVNANTGSLNLARVLQHIETPTPVAGSTSLALRFEGPLDAWRTGSALLEVASLDATAGELPIRLAQPARLRYEAERVVVDSLEANAGDARVSVAGELAAFEPARNMGGLLVTLTGGVGEVARAVAATGLTEVPITGGTGPVAFLARITGSLEAPVVAADLDMGPGSITLREWPPVSGLRFRAHAENGWIEVPEGVASYQDAVVTVTGRVPLSWIMPAAAGVAGTATGDAELHARATNITPAILSPFLDQATIEQIGGSVDAELEMEGAMPDIASVTGELRIDRLDVRVADLPVAQRVPTRIAVRDGFARVEAWDWVGQGATLAVRGQVRLEDRQAAILANGVVDLRMLTPFLRDAGLTTTGRFEPRLSITGALDSPRVDGDLVLTGGAVRLADPRVLVSNLEARAVLTGAGAQITSLTGAVNGGTLTGGGEARYSAGEGLDVQALDERSGDGTGVSRRAAQ